jgi:hypothetical protein
MPPANCDDIMTLSTFTIRVQKYQDPSLDRSFFQKDLTSILLGALAVSYPNGRLTYDQHSVLPINVGICQLIQLLGFHEFSPTSRTKVIILN